MKYSKLIKLAALLLAVSFFAACGTTPVAEEEAETTETAVADTPRVDTFYFEYDKSDIDPNDFVDLDAHAEAIQALVADDPDLRVTIEGHCDERGTEAYNVALGNRRAEAVSRYLRVRGVSAGNLVTVSYGELEPADPASNEEAWAKNRRSVVLSY